jgi:hypothetical protein
MGYMLRTIKTKLQCKQRDNSRQLNQTYNTINKSNSNKGYNSVNKNINGVYNGVHNKGVHNNLDGPFLWFIR